VLWVRIKVQRLDQVVMKLHRSLKKDNLTTGKIRCIHFASIGQKLAPAIINRDAANTPGPQ